MDFILLYFIFNKYLLVFLFPNLYLICSVFTVSINIIMNININDLFRFAGNWIQWIHACGTGPRNFLHSCHRTYNLLQEIQVMSLLWSHQRSEIIILSFRTKKLRRREHPMIPAHSHFHTCESIGKNIRTHKLEFHLARNYS